MKKITKAAVAAGAAAALMLGGAGSLALWNDSKTVDAGTVTTGHLTLDATAAGTWTDMSIGAGTTAFVPGTDHLVPGDTVVYSQTVTIAADGKNLRGALTVGALDAAVPEALAEDVTVTIAAAPTDPKLTLIGSNEVSFAEPGSYEVPVTITVLFAKGVLGTVPTPAAEMGADIDLTALTLTLNQVRP
ncbi:alternate-type signal peptide domain-containing protein [Arthrobacter sp. N199823]|uniref:alternate-type signal peptide domain-containing protein n=1 Tax=Arthrobacter sp. N199823 TaxID=2058895 RepID=UPI0015E3866B|nr:alternate-type signal peptide domain-containing protein [Arthrobacter sp. N199823]